MFHAGNNSDPDNWRDSKIIDKWQLAFSFGLMFNGVSKGKEKASHC
jgi:hypothetical protein